MVYSAVYRLAELVEGFDGPIISNELLFSE